MANPQLDELKSYLEENLAHPPSSKNENIIYGTDRVLELLRSYPHEFEKTIKGYELEVITEEIGEQILGDQRIKVPSTPTSNSLYNEIKTC